MNEIKAKANFHDHELNDITVINPGDWFGKCWLIEIGLGYSSTYLIVEAGSICDAIDAMADSEKHGHHIVVEDDNLDDYDPDSCHYGPSGQVLDLDHLMIYGSEGSVCPFLCRYFGGDLPTDGMSPTEFHCREEV